MSLFLHFSALLFSELVHSLANLFYIMIPRNSKLGDIRSLVATGRKKTSFPTIVAKGTELSLIGLS